MVTPIRFLNKSGSPGPGYLAAAALGVISALHFLWATGSTWPAKDAGRISGSPGGGSPGPLACIAVGKLLALAAALVAGFGQDRRFWRIGRDSVGIVLTVRGIAGVTGTTDRLVPGQGTTPEFKRLDRRVYGPLCLTLALLIHLSRPGRRSGGSVAG